VNRGTTQFSCGLGRLRLVRIKCDVEHEVVLHDAFRVEEDSDRLAFASDATGYVANEWHVIHEAPYPMRELMLQGSYRE
jgi:hypothetical protein